MKTFLIQAREDGQVMHQFSYELLDSIRYNNWYYNEKVYDYILINNIKDYVISNFVLEKFAPKDCVPVGSLEFVFDYILSYHGKDKSNFRPINIPLELQQEKYLRRQVSYLYKKDIKIPENGQLFVKSTSEYKNFAEIVSNIDEIPDDNEKWLVSDYLEIESEWRCFVYEKSADKLVGLQNYSGDFTWFPDVNLIYQMINDYKDAPPAYTIDIGISADDKIGTFLIEAHDFVSCGLYGFADYRILPQMFVSAFDWFINN